MTCNLEPVTGPVGVPSTFYCYECMAWHRESASVSRHRVTAMDKLLDQNTRMLNHLKKRLAESDGLGWRADDWELIHSIDPDWPNPWEEK